MLQHLAGFVRGGGCRHQPGGREQLRSEQVSGAGTPPNVSRDSSAKSAWANRVSCASKQQAVEVIVWPHHLAVQRRYIGCVHSKEVARPTYLVFVLHACKRMQWLACSG